MAQQEIPLTNSRDFSFTVELDGEEFLLRLRYNVRQAAYYIDISDSDGAPIVTGRKLTRNTAPLNGVVLQTRPLGALVFLDAGDSPSEARPDSLGETHQLIYIDRETFDDLV